MPHTAYQGYEFLAALYTGLVIGLLYTLCTFLRQLFLRRKLPSAFIDALFWILAGGITFLAMLLINGARPRGYLFLGLGMGITLHFCSIGLIIKKTASFFSRIRKGSEEPEARQWPRRKKPRKKAVG